MKKLFPLLLFVCCLTSCVTLFNRKDTHFLVKAERGAQILYHKEYTGVQTKKGIVKMEEGAPIPLFRTGVAVIITKRSRTEKVPVTVKKGEIEKTVYVRPVHSFKYYLNFAHLYPFLAFGFLIDHNNPNRFGYPRKIFVDIADTSGKYYSYTMPPKYEMKPHKPGYFHIDFGPPIFNVFAYDLEHLEPAASPFGTFAGIGYQYDVHKSLSVEAGVASIKPFGSSPSHDTLLLARYGLPRYESKSGWYVNVKDNREIGRFELGYGLSFASQEGKAYYSTMKGDDSVIYRRQDVGVGACVSVYYRLLGFLAPGFSLQPQFFTLNNGVKFDYSYTLSFGVKLRLDLLKRK